ncbi:hypothetical protein DZF91_30860 [Actinomadura logoneensis]|uniref:Ava_C0101 and related proteins n=1 Tax=Actinomadura logoneensis TaxID=2293572 RepID=A0A372JCU3_9ACTN|nr:DUF5996 family protein [Actinomadura logoneensis]RFU37825.1 hypothetical protein DZF91_30860 [Actinomadura logoneensis]
MSTAPPELPYDEWADTKDTLHLWTQIVGKIQLASVPPRNHWWHVTLRVDEHGYSTQRLVHDGVHFRISFDLVQHRLVVRTRGREEAIPLRDGVSVSAFYYELEALLRELGIRVEIKAVPFGVPITTPFADDTEHASYDRSAVERFRDALVWADDVFSEFQSWFCGKASPVQLFWHSFDLATARYSGRPAPPMQGVDGVTAEAYSHEVISCGWWAGDSAYPRSAFYSYTHPEPDDLTEQALVPVEASWEPTGPTHQARLPYDVVRTAEDPRGTLLDFLQSAYAAGARTAAWPYDEFHSSFCPPRGRVVGV